MGIKNMNIKCVVFKMLIIIAILETVSTKECKLKMINDDYTNCMNCLKIKSFFKGDCFWDNKDGECLRPGFLDSTLKDVRKKNNDQQDDLKYKWNNYGANKAFRKKLSSENTVTVPNDCTRKGKKYSDIVEIKSQKAMAIILDNKVDDKEYCKTLKNVFPPPFPRDDDVKMDDLGEDTLGNVKAILMYFMAVKAKKILYSVALGDWFCDMHQACTSSKVPRLQKDAVYGEEDQIDCDLCESFPKIKEIMNKLDKDKVKTVCSSEDLTTFPDIVFAKQKELELEIPEEDNGNILIPKSMPTKTMKK